MPGMTAALPRQADAEPAEPGSRAVIDLPGLDAVIGELRRRGWTVIGPTERSGAIVHAEITGVADLPRGRTDEQAPAHYRLGDRDDEAVLGFVTPAHAWKSQLFPARLLLWQGDRATDGSFVAAPAEEPAPAYALFGVRSCDLHAIRIHDQVLTQRAVRDEQYAATRAAAFVVAVGCTAAGGTCFCADMGTGPHPDHGFDLCVTELLDGAGHRFLVEVGTALGAEVLAAVAAAEPTEADVETVDRLTAETAMHASGRLDTTDLRDLLYDNVEHPRWDDVAERCLACGNCALVCPTCFCTSVDDVTDLTGEHTERWRSWDSCFAADFSYIHGGNVRASVASRYRQWATHKLAAWFDQFGTSGCVGCGRCITWCPVAIDITEEVGAIRASARRRSGR